MTKGLDYTGRIPGAVLQQQGYSHVFRYLGDPSVWPKAMTLSEVTDLRANGVYIHLNYEQTADFMLGGYSAGQRFAPEARKWATALGFHHNDPIYYSADFDVSDGQVSTVLDFLLGAASADGGKTNVGVYGGYKIVSTAINQGYIAWQASAWSYGKFDNRAIALQNGTVTINGVDCDVNLMNPLFQEVTTSMSNPIPVSIGQKWAEIASQFTGTYDDSTAIIWADAGARYAAARTDDIMNKLDTMQPVAGTTLSAADIQAIAKAVVLELSKATSQG